MVGADTAPLSTDTIGALEYFQRAFRCSHPDALLQHFVSAGTTEAAYVAHRTLCQLLSTQPVFGREQMQRIWRAATLQDLPQEADALWREGVVALEEYDQLFRSTSGAVDAQVQQVMERAVRYLRSLFDQFESQLSELQLHLVLDNLQDVLGPLAGKRDEYVAPAAHYAEKMAFSALCYGK